MPEDSSPYILGHLIYRILQFVLFDIEYLIFESYMVLCQNVRLFFCFFSELETRLGVCIATVSFVLAVESVFVGVNKVASYRQCEYSNVFNV